MYFKEGELNVPGAITDQWNPGQYDFANQSACGIPDSAFLNSKVAIHPYWLKYAPDDLGLNRKILVLPSRLNQRQRPFMDRDACCVPLTV